MVVEVSGFCFVKRRNPVQVSGVLHTGIAFNVCVLHAPSRSPIPSRPSGAAAGSQRDCVYSCAQNYDPIYIMPFPEVNKKKLYPDGRLSGRITNPKQYAPLPPLSSIKMAPQFAHAHWKG